MRRLAKDDDIAVAGPVLAQSPRLAEADLVDIARTKSQAHLLAISGRAGIGEAVTDVLVRRGDREVVRSVADNQPAQLSEERLLRRWSSAPRTTATWPRRSACAPTFRRICSATAGAARPRWCSSACSRAAKPETQAEIQRVLARSPTNSAPSAAPRDYSRRAAHGRWRCARSGKLGEADARRLRQGRANSRRRSRRWRVLCARADRCGRPADGRRPAGSDPDPLQVGRLWLADRRARSSWRGRAPRARRARRSTPPIANFERLSAVDRAARGAVLAGAATGSSGDRLIASTLLLV